MKALGAGSVASIIRTGLEVMWWVLIVAALGLMAAAAAYIVILAGIGAGLWSAEILQPGQGRMALGPITIDITHSKDRLVWPVAATALLAGAVAVAGSLLIVDRLRKLFTAFSSGEPFSVENAQHLRVIWIVMLAMELSRYVIAATVFTLLMAFGQPDDVEFRVKAPVNLATWGAILVLIVLAEVFREGARLREIDKLTI